MNDLPALVDPTAQVWLASSAATPDRTVPDLGPGISFQALPFQRRKKLF